MSRYVLFTCVGSTDPVRDNYDGPMLHIIRHYRPYAVYIFFSGEMGRREEKDRRFTRAVDLLSRELSWPIDKHLIFSGIQNPHDFDAFIGVFSKHLEEISKDHPEATILLNVSSGTPQMMSMLCLETVVSSKRLVPVQVITPAARANLSKMGGPDYDVEWEFGNNLDNEPDAPNRCVQPDIQSFKRALARGQVTALLENYNYEGAALILGGYGLGTDSTVMGLLRFAIALKNLDSDAKGSQFQEARALTGYPQMDWECLEICEYCNVVKLLQRTGQLADFLLRLNPLVTELQTKFLKYCLGFAVEAIIEERHCAGRKNTAGKFTERLVRRDKIRALNPELLAYLDECHNGEYRDGSHVNIRMQNCLINFFLRKNPDSQTRSFAGFLDTMEILNRDRNLAAHNLYGVLEEDIKQRSGLTGGQIVDKLENLIKFIFKGRCKPEIFTIFDTVNNVINGELERFL
ncbi:type III-A CRISPR-associated CARF protein Csm6 [Thermincola potens]|uniref:CRISPR-associated protein Csm6 n=1 Tax=Thermincola potens (strain JR) TaxID=635013 RepID=D5X8I5_THEPJ|nr:CRISPR-associated protein Csm6 [Thermincola potens]ADG82861.1 CRISPR-associated protein Csm6 [Thermincola potens JR]